MCGGDSSPPFFFSTETLAVCSRPYPLPFVILRACDFLRLQRCCLLKTIPPAFVILRACDFLQLQRCCLLKTIPSPEDVAEIIGHAPALQRRCLLRRHPPLFVILRLSEAMPKDLCTLFLS